MSRIAELAKFVGRDTKVTEVADLLGRAVEGNGQILFINGEAGVGKTRFIHEIRSLPIGQRFNWLTATCIDQEGIDPYLPFTDALKGWLEPQTTITPKSSEILVEKSIVKKIDINQLARIPVIGPKLTEEPSMFFGSFMIKEPKSDFSLAVFSTLIEQYHSGLCITRIPPDKLSDLSKNDGVKILWLSSKPGESSIPPSLTKISHEIIEFIKGHSNSVVMLDGLEHLISHIEFNKVLRFVNVLVDSMAVYNCVLLIPINTLTIDPKQLALLERNMNSIDVNTIGQFDSVSPDNDSIAFSNSKFNEEQLQQGRNRMFETTTRKILDLAAVKPVALFIDDLHWADVGALNLLHYLARSVKNHPVAIIGAYRPEDLTDDAKPHPLQSSIDRLVPEKQLKQISLNRFDKFETAGIIDSLLQQTQYPEELADFIYEETEGNPFFIEEMLRSLEEDGIIKYYDNLSLWKFNKKLLKTDLPETIKDVVHARINKLSKDSRFVLEIASVLGVEFDYNLLAEISKLEEDQLVTTIDELIRCKLLAELPTKFGQLIHYHFVHNKICEVLYNGLGESRRRLLHSNTASAIEKRHKHDLDSIIYELAQHCYLGGDYKKGLGYQMKAGEKAFLGYAPEKSRTFYHWALDSYKLVEAEAEPKDLELNKKHLEILAKLSETCIFIGEWDEALKITQDLQKLSEELGDTKKQVDSLNYTGQIYIHRSSWSEAIQHFENGQALAKEINYQQGMMEADNGLGEVHERTGEYWQAMKYYQSFMELAKAVKSQTEVARGYKAIAMISTNRGEYKEALEYYQKCIDLFSKTDNYTELAKAYTNIGIPYFELGEFNKVIEWNEKCIELATRTGDIRTKGLGYSNSAEVYARIHNFDKALDYANKALDIFAKLDEKPMIGLVWMNYGIIYKNKQDWQPARLYFEKSLALLKELNVPYYLADCTYQFGLMLAEQGTNDSLIESRKYLNEALKIFKSLGAKKFIDVIQAELDDLTN